jgi:hypothetical protein
MNGDNTEEEFGKSAGEELKLLALDTPGGPTRWLQVSSISLIVFSCMQTHDNTKFLYIMHAQLTASLARL